MYKKNTRQTLRGRAYTKTNNFCLTDLYRNLFSHKERKNERTKENTKQPRYNFIDWGTLVLTIASSNFAVIPGLFKIQFAY